MNPMPVMLVRPSLFELTVIARFDGHLHVWSGCVMNLPAMKSAVMSSVSDGVIDYRQADMVCSAIRKIEMDETLLGGLVKL